MRAMWRWLVIGAIGCGGGQRELVPLRLSDEAPVDAAAQEPACRAGNGRACVALGGRYYRAEEVDRDDAVARTWFARGCEVGASEGCMWQGVMTMNGEGGPRDLVAALHLLRPACTGGLARACIGVELLSYQGAGGLARDQAGALRELDGRCIAKDGVACGFLAGLWLNDAGLGDEREAVGYARRGCELDDAMACHLLGVVTYNGVGVSADVAAGFEHFARACDLGWGEACATLGASLSQGHNITADPARGVAVLRRGCQLASYLACRVLAATVQTTDGAAAVAAATRACDGGDAGGCAVLGLCFADGLGVARDLERANQLFRSACERAEGESAAGGCYYLARSYLDGRGVAADPAAAVPLLETACEHDWGEACTALADLVAPTDPARATALRARACTLGDACPGSVP